MFNPDFNTKKTVNLSLNKALVQESHSYCGSLSAKVEELLQADVISERKSRLRPCMQVHQIISEWNAYLDKSGSYADIQSTL